MFIDSSSSMNTASHHENKLDVIKNNKRLSVCHACMELLLMLMYSISNESLDSLDAILEST